MTLKEAVLAMLDGKKVRHSSHFKDSFMYFVSGEGFLYRSGSFTSKVNYSLSEINGYELYQEPPTQERYIDSGCTLNGETLYRKVLK